MAMHVVKAIGLAPKLMTESAFDDWCDEDTRAEFKDGEIIMASPVSLRHMLIFKFLLKLLDEYGTRKGLGNAFGSEYQIRLRPNLRRIPDLMFIAPSRLHLLGNHYFDGAPDLLVEIVSPSSVARDWRDKYLEYAEAGVREYWVIDPQAQRMEWYALNAERHYELIEPQDGVYHSRVLDGFYLRDEWLWQESLPDAIEIVRKLGVTV